MTDSLTRRQWLGACACCVGLAAGGGARATPAAAEAPAETPTALAEAARQALERLVAGNKRFSAGHPKHNHESVAWRTHLVEGQKPFATIIACSDSRVAPELVFDVGLGELFDIRLAGNIVAEDVVGSLQYAVAHLRTPLVVVLGHESCGAVTAAVDEMLKPSHEPTHIEALLQLIKPGLTGLDLTQARTQLIAQAVEANVRWSMKQLLALPEAPRTIQKGVTLVGAVYELGAGKVRILS
jgi:carbonic anhydrase